MNAQTRAAERGARPGLDQLEDMSLVAGGPLFRLWRRAQLAGDALEHVRRRVLVLVALTWLPLLLLSVFQGRAWGGDVKLPFLYDIETHLRLLVTLPLLIVAELQLHGRLPPIVRRFIDHGLITDASRPKFDAAIGSALRWRNSVAVEVLLLVFVYVVGVPFIWGDQVALELTGWYATMSNGVLHPSYAGWWMGFVSMPVFQFLVLRWAFRLLLWSRFLLQVSRMDLQLEATHPDGTAGLHFLSRSIRAYRLLLIGMGASLAGMIADRIFFAGAKLMDFKPEIVGTVALLALVILGPMLVFTSKIRRTRRKGINEFSRLGQDYAREFHRKWLRGHVVADDSLLGSADFQSMADLHNGYTLVRNIQLAPVTIKNLTTVAAYVLLPVAPLLLTTFSVEQLVDRVLKALL
jgi:hypothetical protein